MLALPSKSIASGASPEVTDALAIAFKERSKMAGSTEEAVAFYESFVRGQVLATDARTAEMAKLYGVTDDMEAICAAHDHANRHGLPVRARPEDVGATPDGIEKKADDASAEGPQLGFAGGISVAEGLRLPVFWLLLLATGIVWFCITAVVQHQAIYLGRDQGVDASTLTGVISLFFWCSIIGKFVFGWLSDHFEKVHIMLLAIINLAAGLVILRFAENANIETIYAYAVVYGIGFSGAFTMIQMMVAELFSGPTYGSFLGIYVGVDTIAAAAGIAVIGQIRVATDSYLPAIEFMLGLIAVAFACVVAVRQLTLNRQALAQ